MAIRRRRELGLETEFGDATDPEFVTELPLPQAEWIVSSIPAHPMGLSLEDTRSTLIQLTRTSGFRGRIAVASHHPGDSDVLVASGANLVLNPFQDAADRAVEPICGAPEEERTEIPAIPSEQEEGL